jgi:hypothetical protein
MPLEVNRLTTGRLESKRLPLKSSRAALPQNLTYRVTYHLRSSAGPNRQQPFITADNSRIKILYYNGTKRWMALSARLLETLGPVRIR